MSQPVEVVVPESAAAATVTVEAVVPEGAEALGDAGKKAIDRMKAERDTERSERAKLVRELQEFKDRDLSELDRAKKQAADNAAELAEIRRQNAFLSKGVPLDLIPPADSSPEAFSAYAEALLAWKGVPVPAVVVVPQPRPDQSQGAQPVDASAADLAAYEQVKAANWGYLTPSNTRK